METTAEMKVPFLSFDVMHVPIKDELSVAFNAVLNSGWLVHGKRLEQHEQDRGD